MEISGKRQMLENWNEQLHCRMIGVWVCLRAFMDICTCRYFDRKWRILKWRKTESGAVALQSSCKLRQSIRACCMWCVSSQPWNLVSLSEHSNSLNWIDEARRGMSSFYFVEHFQVVGRHFSESKYLMSRDEALTNDLKLFDASKFLLSHLSCRG